MHSDFCPIDALYLCIDQGGQASRALIFDHHGRLVAEAREPLQTRRPAPDQVEYPADALCDSIRHCVDAAVGKLGGERHRLAAAGLATQRSNVVCWDRHTGHALSPIIGWQDRRARHELPALLSRAAFIHERTGLFPNAHCGAGKLRWCLDHLPEVRRAAEEQRLAFGPMASFLLQHLLDERPLLSDPVNASRTQLLNIKTRDWDPELLELFGLPASALPAVVPNLYPFGTLSVRDLSLPLRLVNGDQSTAIYAYGRVQPDTACVNVGTGAFVSRPSGPVPLTSPHLLTSLVLQKEGGDCEYVLEGTVNGAATALKWLARREHIDNLFELLDDWLAQDEPPPIFLNGIGGTGSPWWIADLKSRFLGEGGKAEKAVAVVESIVFLLNINLENMHRLASPPEQIRITGGLARLDGLCQRLATLSRLPVYRPRECEATGRGLAWLLAGQPDHWPEPGIGIWFTAQEDPALRARYRDWLKEMERENCRKT